MSDYSEAEHYLFSWMLMNNGEVKIPKILLKIDMIPALTEYLKIITGFHMEEDIDNLCKKYDINKEDLK